MPELAAHLERVAKELARDLEKRGFLDSETFRAEVEPILAAALAACAREERLDEARWWQHSIGVDHTGDYADTLEQRARIAALERAVGEKA